MQLSNGSSSSSPYNTEAFISGRSVRLKNVLPPSPTLIRSGKFSRATTTGQANVQDEETLITSTWLKMIKSTPSCQLMELHLFRDRSSPLSTFDAMVPGHSCSTAEIGEGLGWPVTRRPSIHVTYYLHTTNEANFCQKRPFSSVRYVK